MLITRETDYALRILRSLEGGEQKTAAQICGEEMISQQFAYKIMKKLSHAGLIAVARGTDGGCRLTADLRQVSLFDLLQIMGGDNKTSACMQPGFKCAWREKNGSRCNIHCRLSEIQSRLDDSLRGCSLSEMMHP